MRVGVVWAVRPPPDPLPAVPELHVGSAGFAASRGSGVRRQPGCAGCLMKHGSMGTTGGGPALPPHGLGPDEAALQTLADRLIAELPHGPEAERDACARLVEGFRWGWGLRPLAFLERWVDQLRDVYIGLAERIDVLAARIEQLPEPRRIEALEALLALREAQAEAGKMLLFTLLRPWRFFAAIAAAIALGMNDGETLDRFARDFLGLSPNSDERRADERRALYSLLRTSSGWWRNVRADGVLRYLRIAVKREAARLRTDREKEGRLWGWRKNAPAVVYAMDAEMPAPVEQSDPALLFDHQEELRTRRAIIAELRGSHLPSDQDQLLTLMEAGLPAAEAVEIVGNGWSPYQAFQRKARRRLAQRDAEERRRGGV